MMRYSPLLCSASARTHARTHRHSTLSTRCRTVGRLSAGISHLHLRVPDSHAGEGVLRDIAGCIRRVTLTGDGVHLVQPSLRLFPADTHGYKKIADTDGNERKENIGKESDTDGNKRSFDTFTPL